MILFLLVSLSISLQLNLYSNRLPITVCVQSYYKRVYVCLSLQCLLNYSLGQNKKKKKRGTLPADP